MRDFARYQRAGVPSPADYHCVARYLPLLGLTASFKSLPGSSQLNRVRDMRLMRVAPSLAIIVSTSLAACTSTLDSKLTVFADPAKYDFYNCEQLAAQRTARKLREQELKSLMDKAERSTGGAFVNVIAYQADYAEVREDLKLIEAGARAKKCSTPENWQSTSAFR
jgi:hypothetical protein